MDSNANAGTAVVKVESITKVFGRFAALRGVTAQFQRGKLYLLLGENGAGKSTLMRIIAGLARPTSGEVKLAVPREKVGYMAHASFVYDEMSGLENLRYSAGLYGISDDVRCAAALARVGLDPNLTRYARDYSQGMRQRLSLARAIVHDPELLLLDEPFSNVDAASLSQMTTLLGNLRDEGKTIIVVTHQPAALQKVVDETVTLIGGKVLVENPAEVSR
jgi:ABC-type multidrug transport system ATPase subunit